MKTFKQIVDTMVEQSPEFEFLTLVGEKREEKYTIKDLYKRIGDYYHYYQSQSVGKSEIVLIILKESLDLYASFFAGIIYGSLPAFFAYPSPKQSKERFSDAIENLITYNEISLLITFDKVADVLQNSNALNVDRFKQMKTFNEITSIDENPIPNVSACDNEAFLQFSSGTTGAKKGVVISSEALFNQINAYSRFVQFDEKSTIVSWLPHYHDMGLIACMLMPFVKKYPYI